MPRGSLKTSEQSGSVWNAEYLCKASETGSPDEVVLIEENIDLRHPSAHILVAIEVKRLND